MVALDLRGHRLAFSWYYNLGGAAEIRRTEILLQPDVGLPRRPLLIARARAGGAGNATVFSPSLAGGAVYYARGGGSCDYPSTPNRFGRKPVGGRPGQEVGSPRAHALARDGTATYCAACGRVDTPTRSISRPELGDTAVREGRGARPGEARQGGVVV